MRCWLLSIPSMDRYCNYKKKELLTSCTGTLPLKHFHCCLGRWRHPRIIQQDHVLGQNSLDNIAQKHSAYLMSSKNFRSTSNGVMNLSLSFFFFFLNVNRKMYSIQLKHIQGIFFPYTEKLYVIDKAFTEELRDFVN